MQLNLNLAGAKKAITELGAVAAIVVPAVNEVPMSAATRTALMAIGGVVLSISHAFTAKKLTVTTDPTTARPDGLKWSGALQVPAGPPAVTG